MVVEEGRAARARVTAKRKFSPSKPPSGGRGSLLALRLDVVAIITLGEAARPKSRWPSVTSMPCLLSMDPRSTGRPWKGDLDLEVEWLKNREEAKKPLQLLDGE